MAKKRDGLVEVDLRGHKTQDDFEYSENFGLVSIVTDENGKLNIVRINLAQDFPEKGSDKGCSCFTWQPE